MAVSNGYWLICYDIRQPKRLQRIHRYCKKWAMPLQRSVFISQLSSTALQAHIAKLEEMIDTQQDDIRIYPIDNLHKSVICGTSRLPEMLEAAIKQDV